MHADTCSTYQLFLQTSHRKNAISAWQTVPAAQRQRHRRSSNSRYPIKKPLGFATGAVNTRFCQHWSARNQNFPGVEAGRLLPCYVDRNPIVHAIGVVDIAIAHLHPDRDRLLRECATGIHESASRRASSPGAAATAHLRTSRRPERDMPRAPRVLVSSRYPRRRWRTRQAVAYLQMTM